MKAAVVFLVFLGLLAAVSAAVLIQTLTRGPKTAATTVVKVEEDIELPIAARDLDPMTIIDARAITTKKVKKAEISQEMLTNSVQLVGRVLATRMLAGEPFRKQNFAREGTGLHLAATLPPGKRAVSINLADWSGMAGLLYPGSIVDVLVTLRSDSSGGRNNGSTGSANVITTTLLQGLQVLAIGSQSVTAEEYEDKAPGALSGKGKVDHRMITLLVDPKQAEILQLAVQNGTISLTMRNPTDVGREAQRIVKASELVNPGGYNSSGITSALAGLLRPPPVAEADGEQAVASNDPFRPAGAPARMRVAKKDLWEMLIIRGGVEETKTFPMPKPEQQPPSQPQVDPAAAAAAGEAGQPRVEAGY